MPDISRRRHWGRNNLLLVLLFSVEILGLASNINKQLISVFYYNRLMQCTFKRVYDVSTSLAAV